MLCRIRIRKSIALALAISILNVYTVVSVAKEPEKEPVVLMGAISITGEVKINGASAFSGSTVFSGSTIETGGGSSAVVRLGGASAIELLPNSTLTLSFDDKAIRSSLDRGQTRFSLQTGTKAIVKTRDGSVLAGDAQPNLFVVSAECNSTTVYAKQGDVELQAENTRKLIAAGHKDSIGSPIPGCLPLQDDDDDEGLDERTLAAILTGAVAAVLVAIILVDRNDEVVSPMK